MEAVLTGAYRSLEPLVQTTGMRNCRPRFVLILYFFARFPAICGIVAPGTGSIGASRIKSFKSTVAPSLKPVQCTKAAIGLGENLMCRTNHVQF